MRSTIYDIAQLAGVSTATVSRTFSAPDLVRPATRERVLRVAKTMDYSPNAIASSMARQATDKIAFLVCKEGASVLDEFYAGICEGVMHSISPMEYQLILSTAKEWTISAQSKHIDGAILGGNASGKMIRTFQQQNIPLVLVNNYMDGISVPAIVSDEYDGVRQVLNHLYQRGHRKIALLTGRFSPYIVGQRYSAFLNVAQNMGLFVPANYIRMCQPTIEDAVEVATAMLSQDQRPTAILATNDLAAIGAMKAALRLGLRIPQDIAITGYDDSLASRMVEPELTTIGLDKARMGEVCAQELRRLLAGHAPSAAVQKIPVTLCIRGST